MSKRTIEVQENNTDSLLNKHGVEGTAVGQKWVDGKPTGKEAILVFVEKKHPKSSITSTNKLSAYTADDLIPSTIDGIPTDVIEVGQITKQTGFKSHVRPVQPGYSCGHGLISAGTIGGIFLDDRNKPVILSNNHVIANENLAKVGDLIYQPGPSDYAKKDSNAIGKLFKYVRLKRKDNDQDSAIARINGSLLSSNMISDIYPQINNRLTGFAQAKIGQTVQKCGRTTGYTTGRVLGLNASFSIRYDFGMARFNKCIVLSAMSKGGDSGSIIQDMDGNAIGLLFAGSEKVTIANPIDIVRERYGLKLYSEVNVSSSKNTNWKIIKSDGANIRTSRDPNGVAGNAFNIVALKNHYCCIERPIGDFTTIGCDINTGTDTGIAWGPGLSVHWPNGFIKINLRHGSSFGGYSHLDTNFEVGKVRPNTTYGLRIVKLENSYVGEIRDGGPWIKVIEVPKSILSGSPNMVRLGKTDIRAECRQHHFLGTQGHSSVFGYYIF
jgi:hypothetical protein